MGVIEGGINLGAPILPATEEDIFPTHDAKYGKGGYRTVTDADERNSIPPARRELGMAVRTLDDNVVWILINNPAASENAGMTQNSDWQKEVDILAMDGGVF